MCHFTLLSLLFATSFASQPLPQAELLPLLEKLLGNLETLLQLVADFRSQPITPEATARFEKQLQELIRALGHTTVEWTYNSLEPNDPQDAPARLEVEGEKYRRRDKHPRPVATLFGKIQLWRLLYEPLEPGLRCLHPLEGQLGLEAGCASPALAERVGLWAAQHPQRGVLAILLREYGIKWSHKTLREVTASLAQGMAVQRQGAQCRRLLELLRQAQQSKGRYRIVLAVGRDGIHVPLRYEQYREGAAATVSVYDRRGRRLGTVYLGRMPQPGQATLSAQLTALVQEVLQAWQGPKLRLAYITDGGWHPTDYYLRVLRQMEDPRRPGQRLVWERVIDFYHATEYITKLAEALFGKGRRAQVWANRMRKRLKEDHGVTRVLQSAGYHHSQSVLSAAREEAYQQAHGYLQRHRRWMDYARYRKAGIPLGSGVTEAACKTVFTQRVKQSGMQWGRTGGQAIVDLRVVWLSGVWDETYQSYLRSKTSGSDDTYTGATTPTGGKLP